MKVCLFAYDFPHRKTQDFIFYLTALGYKPELIIAAPKENLNIPPHTIKTKLNYEPLIHPAKVAQALKIDYRVLKHNTEEVVKMLAEKKYDLGVIAGARILKQDVIDRFRFGIVNFHPGFLPTVRGLDSLLWSILNGIDLAVSAHLIDSRVDSGRIIERQKIICELEDTLPILNEKLYQKQLAMLESTLKKVEAGLDFLELPPLLPKPFPKMSQAQETKVLRILEAYLIRKS